MSIRASAHGGNARHPVSRPIFLAFLPDRESRSQFLFAAAKVAAPLALVAGLVVAGSLQRGASPIAELAQPGPWTGARAVPAAVIAGAVADPAALASRLPLVTAVPSPLADAAIVPVRALADTNAVRETAPAATVP